MSAKNKFLHTMIRVSDLNKSLEFYTKKLGMNFIRQKDYLEGKFTLAFVGFGNEEDSTVLELTYNWNRNEPYDIGDGFGHIAIGVDDIYKTCEELTLSGIKITRPPGPMKHGNTIIAFIEDPDGYKIELVER